ncbi:MAG: hypothetical protein V7776_21865 [Halopseudomonas aestusnigri]
MIKVTHGSQTNGEGGGSVSGISDVPGLLANLNAKQDIITAFDGNYASLLKKPATYCYFPIWAEENADIADNTYEWAFGNGGNTSSGMGVVLAFDCDLIGIGLSIKGITSVEVEVIKNTVSTNKSVSIINDTKAHSVFDTDPVSFFAGDVVNFRTLVGSTGSDASIVTAWFRRKLI